MTELDPANQAILKYLRKQVDRLQDERYRQDARPSIKNELQIAIRDLKRFTSELRQKGYNTMQVDVISSVPVEMMYSEEDMDKAGFMRLNKVILAISFP